MDSKTIDEKHEKQFMQMNKHILYKKTSEEVGSRVLEGNKDKKRYMDGKFTKVSRLSIIYKQNFL
jgi:hypothetical protein